MAVKKATPKKKQVSKQDVIQGEIVLLREAPPERRIEARDILQPSMSAAQLSMVTGQTPSWAVKVRQGKGGKAFKYVPHGYVTDTLNKAFGFNWDLIIDAIEDGKLFSLYEEKNSKGEVITRHISIAGHLIVRIRTKEGVQEIVKSGFGSQTWNNTMEFGDALKGARSDLIKTCAYQLGIGLDLYYNEQAELEQYATKVVDRSESQRLASELLTSEPTTVILLMSRAMTDYKLDGAGIAKLCKITMDELMEIEDPTEIAKIWKRIKDAKK